MIISHFNIRTLWSTTILTIMRMLPCPDAGAVFGFNQTLFRIFHRIDQLYIAFICFRGFIHHSKDSPGTGHGHDDGVHLLRNLGNRTGEISVQCQEGYKAAQSHGGHLMNGQQASDHGAYDITQVSQIIVYWADDIRECIGTVGR